MVVTFAVAHGPAMIYDRFMIIYIMWHITVFFIPIGLISFCYGIYTICTVSQRGFDFKATVRIFLGGIFAAIFGGYGALNGIIYLIRHFNEVI